MSEIDIRVTRARSILITQHPFFGALVMRLIVRARDDIKTLATDGTFLFYCRAFLDRISEPELVFCLAHEVLHCALSHMTRRGNRPWPLWQAATDYVVNLMLHDAGFRVPAWVKYFDEKYRGLTVEQVCQLLQQEEEQKKQDEEKGQPKGGSGAGADCTDDHTAADLEDGQGSIDHMPNQNEDDEAEDGGPDGDPNWDMPGENDDDSKVNDEGAPDWDTGDEDEDNQQGDDDDSGDGRPQPQDTGSGGDQSGIGAESEGSTASSPGTDSPNDPNGTPVGSAGQTAQGAETNQPLAPSFGDPGGCGEVLDAAPPHEQAKLDEVADEWQVYTRQAANVARRAGEGKLPGFIEEIVEELDNPHTDWREELRQFVDPQSSTKDYSWASPNRRMMGLGFFVPGLISDGINHVGMVVDSSSSVDTEWLRKFGGEIQSALDEGAIDKLTLIFADDGIQSTAEYQKGDVIDFTVKGRGGTAFAPSFEWVNENAADVAAVIYFTDLDCTTFGPEPSYPVLWAAYDSFDPRALQERMARVPFGYVVELQN